MFSENQLNVMETTKPQIQRFPINNQPIQFPQPQMQPIKFIPQQPQVFNQFPSNCLNKPFQIPQQFSSHQQTQPIQKGNLISQQFSQNSLPQQKVLPQRIPQFQQGPIQHFPQPNSAQATFNQSITISSDQQTVQQDNQSSLAYENKNKRVPTYYLEAIVTPSFQGLVQQEFKADYEENSMGRFIAKFITKRVKQILLEIHPEI